MYKLHLNTKTIGTRIIVIFNASKVKLNRRTKIDFSYRFKVQQQVLNKKCTGNVHGDIAAAAPVLRTIR